MSFLIEDLQARATTSIGLEIFALVKTYLVCPGHSDSIITITVYKAQAMHIPCLFNNV